MAAWLGIGILVVFSLGLNWFMRGSRVAALELPPDLGVWVRCEDAEHKPSGTFVERRVLLQAGSFLARPHLIEQRRLRREGDGEILQIWPERRLLPGYERGV